MVDRCLPPSSRSNWTDEGQNYMQDVLCYEKQRDVYSFGPYVISTISERAGTKGCMPDATFRSGYEPTLTEKYRGGCVQALIGNIFSSTIGNGLLQSTEFLVDENLLQKRNAMYRSRHTRKKSMEESARKSKCKPISKNRLRSKNAKKSMAMKSNVREQKRVRFQDSFVTAQAIVNDLIDVVVTCSSHSCGLE